MKKTKAWAVMATDERIAITHCSYGLCCIFYSKEQAEAYLSHWNKERPFHYIKEIEISNPLKPNKE